MSKQVNFFANTADTQAIHAWLRQELPGLGVIRGDRGKPEHLQPLFTEDALTGPGMLLLVPAWARGRVVPHKVELESQSDLYVIDLHANPVLEYTPCGFEDQENRVRVGRFYWAFGGPLAKDEQRQIDRLLRWVRSQSVPYPGDNRFRLFKGTASTARMLEFWLEILKPNPLFGQAAAKP